MRLFLTDYRNDVTSDCLKRASNLAYTIARRLDVAGDKLAIYSTFRTGIGPLRPRRSRTLHPYRAPDLDTARARLVDMQKAANRKTNTRCKEVEAMTKAVSEITADTLEKAAQNGIVSPQHVFLLTPRPLEVLQQIRCTAKLVYHHVSPWNDFLRVDDTANPLELTAKAQQSAFQSSYVHPWTDLQTMIRFARTFDRLGHLQNMSVHVEANNGCEIETAHGPMTSITLDAGQALSILVQAKVLPDTVSENSRSTSLAGDVTSTESSMTLNHIIADLEEFLGDTTTELFTVKVRYEHSLFPAGSEIHIQKTCTLRRSLAQSEWSLPRARTSGTYSPLLNSGCTENARSSPVLTHDKETARQNLDASLPGTRLSEHARAINNELAQNTLIKGSPVEQGRSYGKTSNECPTPKESELGTLDADASRKSYDEHQELRSMDSKETLSESPNSSYIRNSPDKARKIWQHMRKESRSQRQINRSSCESLDLKESNESGLCRIKRMAVRNKRSIGASTLQSLRREIKSSEA